jgi:RNA polymerase sigma-70 factor, ECF subfamily
LSSSATAGFPSLPLTNKKAEGAVTHISGPASSEEVSDEILLSRLVEGDSDALDRLFRRYAILIRSIGKRILLDDAEAEDLVQEVFLHLVRRSSAFDLRKGSARSWIVQNIYYRAINRRRYLSSRHQLFVTAPKAPVDLVARAADYDSSESAIFGGALVREILKSLTPEQFETMRLFFFEGYTLAEISENLGQPLGNVRHHYYRGLNRLRARLFLE